MLQNNAPPNFYNGSYSYQTVLSTHSGGPWPSSYGGVVLPDPPHSLTEVPCKICGTSVETFASTAVESTMVCPSCLRIAVAHEIERRKSVEIAKLPWLEKIVQAGYRALAIKYHPDSGGKAEDFVELRAAKEKLAVILEEVKDVV